MRQNMVNERKDIRTLAKKYDKLQTLMCYVNKETLMEQHKKQMKGKASGIDGVTKEQYNENAESNIENLLIRMKKFSYKPQAVKRVYIPKTGSDKLRPLGIPAYEDRLVQGCMAYVLNESDEFINFVSSHKLVEVSSDLHIYWTLRYNKLKKTETVNGISFEKAFTLFLLGKQLPSLGKFKEEYTKAKHNYITISGVLKNWRRKNKKLLSCYVSDDEKQYLEYMLLSNSVDYKELKKFIYNK